VTVLQASAALAGVELPPGGSLIAGEWRTAPLDMAVHDPEDGAVVGFVHRCTTADVDRAVRAAAASLQQRWPLHRRVAALRRAATAVQDSAERFARLIAAEGVKTLAEARGEVLRCVETLQLAAESGDVLTGQTLPTEASARGVDRLGWFTREPLGVIAAISSFNDPLNLVAHKLAPALLAGASIVLKPSDQTPFSALALAQSLLDAGVPAGRLSVVCGGAEVGAAVVAHRDVAVVSFTGGTRTAREISRNAGVKKLLMELGGNNATIVCADADVDLATRKIVAGAFGVAGQNCLSVQRVFVEQPLFSTVVRRVAEGARSLVVGSKHDADTDVGPLVSAAAAARIATLVDAAVAKGARLVTGGTRDGNFYAPTVLTGVPDDDAVMREELFGPVVVIEQVADVNEAIRRANDCEFALQTGVFTASLDTATAVAGRMTVGAVLVNDTSDYRLDAMPFGGFRQSGIGREGIRSAVLELTAPKCVLIAASRGPATAGEQPVPPGAT
jgi:glyceraldehyde-3-phosphate dehydrogenase (NADP+)